MIKNLVVLGHPTLRQYCTPIYEFGAFLTGLVEDLQDTMKAAGGVGLAAPQIDVKYRVAVIEFDGKKLALVNPEITAFNGLAALGEEGCLSIPDMFAQVARYDDIDLYTEDPATGESKNFNIKGFLARAVQHEIDHLNGRLFIDHLGLYKRTQITQAWASQKPHYPNFIRRLS